MHVPKASSQDQELRVLAERYSPAIRAFFRRRTNDAVEVEDLTQEVFASLARRSELTTIDNIQGYIFQIASNLLRMRARRRRTTPYLQYEGVADPEVRLVDPMSPERILLGREALTTFVQALHELPERARTVIVLNRFEELSGREIALRLGVSISTVEKDMIRAIAYLKERLL